MNKKGFTLMELLAVIIVLMIIMLIAVPATIKIINHSKQNSAIDSAYGVKKSIQYNYARTYEVDISKETETFICDFSISTCGIDFDGTKPSSGVVKVESDGTMHFENLVIGGYNLVYIEEEEKFVVGTDNKSSAVVTFNSNGGSKTNYMVLPKGEKIGSLPIPTREQHIFLGWYKNEDLTDEVISTTIIEDNTTLYAKWLKDEFPIVFSLEGPCTFNGQTENITGDKCSKYSNTKYIDTNIRLYDEENYKKDYEIYFEIDEYDPNNQDEGIGQQTFMNSKYENSNIGYPGIVFRRSANNLEITQTIERKKVQYTKPYKQITKVKIVRKDGIIYYSYNDGELKVLQDMNNFTQKFNTTVWFGASADANNNPFRFLNGTLSNMYIKVGKYKE